MKLKIRLLADTKVGSRRYKSGQEIEFDQDEYIDWYYKVGRTIPHDVKETQDAN